MVLLIGVMIEQYDAMDDDEWRAMAGRLPDDLRRRYVESVGRVLALMASVDLEGGVTDGG